MQAGDEVQVTDGEGTLAVARIAEAHARHCILHIVSRKFIAPSAHRLHVAVAPAKSAERNEWMLEKMVELGVEEVSFISTERSERGRMNMERMQKIAVSAMKQSRQSWLPKLNPLATFEHLPERTLPVARLIAWCEAEHTNSLKQMMQPADTIILIGPEGDFTAEEVARARAVGFQPVSFGPRILRTETAAVHAVSSFNTLVRGVESTS
jgi:16S rRNA (uracil1498-N3)-methyltransferase